MGPTRPPPGRINWILTLPLMPLAVQWTGQAAPMAKLPPAGWLTVMAPPKARPAAKSAMNVNKNVFFIVDASISFLDG